MVEIAWLIFIRSESRRLPEKCYQDICGKTILEHIIANAVESGVDKKHLYLCTSVKTGDDRIVKIAESEKINVIRGSEEYPAKRILENQRVLKTYRFICRICGDSPFYNFNVPLKAMRLAAQECQNMPLVISTTQRRCLPSGLSVEIYERKGLIERLAKSKEYQELEHLSEIIAKGYITSDAVWEIVPTGGFRADMQTKLTIDTWEDLEHIRKMLRAGADKSIKDYYSKVGLRLERFVR